MAANNRRRNNAHQKGGSRGAETLAVNTITQKIKDGIYEPGHRLSEARLSQDLGLSRNTIREALRRLASGGLVSFEPNKGARVARLERQDVADLFALREVVEGLATSLAATNVNVTGNRDRVAQMVQEVQAMKAMKSSAGIKKYLEHNTRFHDLLMQLSANKYLVQVGTQLNVPALRPQYFGLMDRSAYQQSLEDHEAIIFAVLDGDPARAEKLMRGHVRRTARGIHRLSDDLFCHVYGARDTPGRRPARGGGRARLDR
jgi:DNA-binding GntR family transcriptional regulator